MRFLIWLGFVSLWAQAPQEELWARRDEVEAAKQAISLLEEALKQNPHEPTAILRLSRLYYLVGESLSEKENRAAKLEYYDRAFRLCRDELAHQLGLSKEATDQEIVEKATSAHLPLLYWAAAGLARWGKHAPFRQKIAARTTIRLYWDKVFALDPAYFHGGGYRFFGGYYALVPAITGEQDLTKSKEMFEQALKVAPYYLETKVLYAEAYAAHPRIRDRALFQKLLNEVLQADPGNDPDYAAENRLSQKKAKRLLAEETELFEE